MPDLAVVPAVSPAEMARFIRLPMRLAARDPRYIAPLLSERQDALSPAKHPFFAHAEVGFWLAVRDGRDVASYIQKGDYARVAADASAPSAPSTCRSTRRWASWSTASTRRPW